MKKRLISLLAVMAMMVSLIPSAVVQAQTSINIGDYVQMGTYYGKPILWRCVDIDENGPLMLSDKILCIKAWDADGDDTSGSHGRGYNNIEYRKVWGSNYWADSNIRDWLNSAENSVTWLCGNLPNKDHVSNGYNAYDKEAGFLTNFTNKEKIAMKAVTQKSLLDWYEYDSSNRNSNYHKYNSSIENVLQNYDTAYSENVTDTMFLLDVKQVNTVYKNFGDYYTAYPTRECVENSEYKSNSLINDNKWYYWLRSPDCNSYDSTTVRCVFAGGDVHNSVADNCSIGVRPAFYLNITSFYTNNGTGTEVDPYTVDVDNEILTPSPTATPSPTPTETPSPTPTAAPSNSGVDGSISWKVSGGVLELSGSGKIPEHNTEPAPWAGFMNEIKEVTVGDGITTVGKSSLEGLTKAEKITLPSTLTTIDSEGFKDCISLSDITIPSGMTGGIGDGAFKGCAALPSITIPGNVSSIGSGAFEGCTSLKSVTLPFIGSQSGDKNNIDTFGYIFGGNVPDSLTRVKITNETVIPENAFAGLDKIENITVNSEVDTIGNGAFDGCKALREFIIPNGVSSIGDNTFKDCESAVRIPIPNKVRSIGKAAFDGCRVLREVNIPDGIKYLADNTFRNCEMLTSIEIPNSVTSIGTGVLEGCKRIVDMKLPFIGANSDPQSNGGTSGYLGYIYGSASNTEVLPALTKIEITGSDTFGYIPEKAFKDCGNIIDVIIDGGNSVRNCAFENCKNLKNLYIAKSISTIGKTILKDCTRLETLVVPFVGSDRRDFNTETSVLGGFFGYDDDSQVGIKQYYDNSNNYHFYNIPTSLKNISVLSQTTIPVGAFSECVSLQKVAIVTGAEIYPYAFYHCKELKNVSLPNNLSKIGDLAFAECEKLETINIPTKVKEIGSQAFYNAMNLKNVTMPDSITSIADDVFNGTNLVSGEEANLLANGRGVITCSEGSEAYKYAVSHGIKTNVVSSDKLEIRKTSTTVTLLSTNAYLFDITDTYNMHGNLHVELYGTDNRRLKEVTRETSGVEYRIEFTEDDMAQVSYVKVYVADENGTKVSTEDETVSGDDIPNIPESDIVMQYNNINKTVSFSGETNIKSGTVLIEAVYANDKLENVRFCQVSGKDDVISVSGTAGVKYMLWSSLYSMKQLAEPIEVR